MFSRKDSTWILSVITNPVVQNKKNEERKKKRSKNKRKRKKRKNGSKEQRSRKKGRNTKKGMTSFAFFNNSSKNYISQCRPILAGSSLKLIFEKEVCFIQQVWESGLKLTGLRSRPGQVYRSQKAGQFKERKSTVASLLDTPGQATATTLLLLLKDFFWMLPALTACEWVSFCMTGIRFPLCHRSSKGS